MDCATKSASLGFQFNFNFPKRERIISKMSEMLCLNEAQPFEIEVQLTDESKIKVVCFDFQEMCYSILWDETIMQDKNNTFRNDDPRSFTRKGNDSIYLRI